MGAGQIVSETGNGLYQIKLVFGDQLDTKLEQLATKRAKLESELLLLRAAQIDLDQAAENSYRALQDVITAWQSNIVLPDDPVPDPPTMSTTAYEYVMRTSVKFEIPKALTTAFTQLLTDVKLRQIGERKIADKQAEYLALLKRQSELTTLKETEVTGVSAWCADFTEGMTGQVATLEVFGEYDPLIGGGVNIKPGYDNADWAASYGKLQRSLVVSESGFAWNMTMLNPWEKWMPKWRYAKITAIDTDTNLVNLELLPVVSKTGSYLSKIKTLNEPWESRMTDVVVQYMGCNASAFEIDDEVVVEFTKTGDTYTPMVIGFKDHPKDCIIWPDSEVGILQPLIGPQTNIDFETFARLGPCYEICPGICWGGPNGNIYQALWERAGEFVLTFDFSDPDFSISPIGNYSLENFISESRTRQRFFRTDVIYNCDQLAQTGSLNVKTYSQTSPGGDCVSYDIDPITLIPYCYNNPCFKYPGDIAEIVNTVYDFANKEEVKAWICPQLPYLTVRHIATGRIKNYPCSGVRISNFGGPKIAIIYEKP